MTSGFRRLFFLAVLTCVLAISGCSKIENENPVVLDRHSLLFFNYSIPGTTDLDPRGFHPKAADRTRYEGMTLHVTFPEDYLPTSVLAAFQDETNAYIEVQPFQSDMELFRRVSDGKAGDLILASDYLIEQLIAQKRLQTLNQRYLPNLTGVDAVYQRPAYDPIGAYSIPYDWTVEGIAYDFTLVERAPQSWGDLFNPAPENLTDLIGHVALTASGHQTFSSALIYLKESPLLDDTVELENAAQFLRERMKTLQIRLLTDSQMEKFTQHDVIMAQTNSGVAARAVVVDPHVRFVVPEDGTWVTVSNLAIPSSTDPDEKELAQIFANYLLKPRVAALVADHSLRASTITAALPYIEPRVRLGPSYVAPPSTIADYRKHHSEKAAVLRADLWNELVEQRKDQAQQQQDAELEMVPDTVPPVLNPEPSLDE